MGSAGPAVVGVGEGERRVNDLVEELRGSDMSRSGVESLLVHRSRYACYVSGSNVDYMRAQPSRTNFAREIGNFAAAASSIQLEWKT